MDERDHPWIEQQRRIVEQLDEPPVGLANPEGWTLSLDEGSMGMGWNTDQSGVCLSYERDEVLLSVTTGSRFLSNELLNDAEVVRLASEALVYGLLVGIDEPQEVDDADEHDWLVDESTLDDHDQQCAERVRQVAEQDPEAVRLPIDGKPLSTTIIRNEDSWIAWDRSTGLILMARHIEPHELALTRQVDLTPFFDALRTEVADWPPEPADDADFEAVRSCGPERAVDPEAQRVVAAFATALTAGEPAVAAGLLIADVVDAHGGASVYAKQLGNALTGVAGTRWRADATGMGPDDGAADEHWFHLSDGPPWQDAGVMTLQGIVRLEGDVWRLDIDVLNPRYQPRPQRSLGDPRRMLGLQQLENLTFPAFGLVDWKGPAAVGGHGGGGCGNSVDSVTLVHGELWAENGPSRDSVTVETSRRSSSMDWGSVLYNLVHTTLAEPAEDHPHRAMRELSREVELYVQKLRLQPRETCSVRVDGTEIPAEIVHFRGQAAVQLRIRTLGISVTGPEQMLAQLSLTELDTIERYLNGSIKQSEAMQERHTPEEGEENEQLAAIQISIIGGSPDGGLEDDAVDFAVSSIELLSGSNPDAIATATSERVIASHGGREAYAEALARALSRNPVWHAGWANQPRRVSNDTCEWQVQLLFEGENPLKRTRILRLAKENNEVRLDTDLAALASRKPRPGPPPPSGQ